MIYECPTCKNPLLFTKTDNLIHHGRLDCVYCQKFIKWIKNPNTKEKMRGVASKHNINQIMKFHKFDGEPFCFFCLRGKEQLGIKETLTRDHIKELNKGGGDILENLQILCFACHKLKNWARLYLNWHLKKERGKDDTNTKTTSK